MTLTATIGALDYAIDHIALIAESMRQAMCGFVADIINFEALTAQQKRALKKELARRRQALQARVNDLNRALKAFGKKSKRSKR